MEKLILIRRRKRESKSGNIAVKVRTDTYEIINEIKEATGFSASKVVKILVDYAYDNIEWEEE
jgi:hypothetical protein